MPGLPIVLDFTLRQGEFLLELRQRCEARAIALTGPSGAGKTTVLEAIAGLRDPVDGEIQIGDHELFASTMAINVAPRFRRIGYVPQDLALFHHLNVRHNINYGATRGPDGSFIKIVELLEIAPLLSRRVTDLSGGERQRVAIARALVSSPDLLLLDEPLAAVDAPLRGRILSYIERVRDELRKPLLYVSHAAAEVRRIADWVIELDRGRVVRAGPPTDGD